MALSTYPISLMYDTSLTETPTWTKLVDIKDFPDLGGAPDSIEVTTMSDAGKTYIAGIKDQKALEFTANYDETVFETINALDGGQDFRIYFGSAGASGKFAFSGSVSAYVTGAGVSEVVEMKVVVVPSTVIISVA